MSGLHPLAVYPWPIPGADRKHIYAGLDKLRPPFALSLVEAVPGGPVRVLALRELPPWLCDAAQVSDPASTASMAAALRWVLDAGQPLERGFNVLDYLTTIFGENIHELSEYEIAREEFDG